MSGHHHDDRVQAVRTVDGKKLLVKPHLIPLSNGGLRLAPSARTKGDKKPATTARVREPEPNTTENAPRATTKKES